MKYLSLFSGIEACTVAWHPLGWKPVAFAEFEDFPKAVLARNYPDVPDLGDVTKITEEQVAALGPIDLVVGGSPCQDLSIAGLRAGLRTEEGETTRSGLFDEQIRIFEIARRRNGARYLLWENVPGAFSSNGGRDFAYVLGSMAGRSVLPPQMDGKPLGSVLERLGSTWSSGGLSTLSIPESPSVVVESSLYSILESGGVGSRYYLSKKECAGILRRAETRGKVLPKELKEALERVVQSSTRTTPRTHE